MTRCSSSWRLGTGALFPVGVGEQSCRQCTRELGVVSGGFLHGLPALCCVDAAREVDK